VREGGEQRNRADSEKPEHNKDTHNRRRGRRKEERELNAVSIGHVGVICSCILNGSPSMTIPIRHKEIEG